MRRERGKAWTSLALVLGASFAYSQAPVVSIDPSAAPSRSISAYHLFQDVANQVPSAGLIPYEINTPLFSDYAVKHRFFHVPPGTMIAFNPDLPLELPVGSVLVKTFGFLNDRRDVTKGERIVETRILMHRPEGWVGYPYVWNDDLSEARLAVAGTRVDLRWVHDDGTLRELRYNVPNMNQCKQCHKKSEVMGPIGFRARQLNRAIPTVGGETQLQVWARLGILTGLPGEPEEVPRLPVWNDPATGSLDQRARAYLDANCAHCHNPGGEGGSTGLDLRWEQHEPVAYGIEKLPTAAGPASRGYIHAIQPGAPERSFLLNRLRSTDPVIMMPRTGRSLVHAEGVALIEAWISEMDPGLHSPDLSGAETRN